MDDRSEHPGTPRPGADADGADGADGAASAGGGARRGARSPLTWLLVTAAVLPPVVLAEVSRRFLTGGADTSYFGPHVSEAVLRTRIDFTFSVRFRLLWATVPVPDVLIASTAALLVLAAVVLAGRPARLVPPRWGRRVVAGAALLAALEGLTCLLVLLDLTDEPRSDPYGNLQLTYLLPNTGTFPEIVPVLVLLAVTAGLSLLAALALRRAGGPGASAGAVPAAPDAVAPAPDPEATAPEAPGPPRPEADALAAYRRPGSAPGPVVRPAPDGSQG